MIRSALPDRYPRRHVASSAITFLLRPREASPEAPRHADRHTRSKLAARLRVVAPYHSRSRSEVLFVAMAHVIPMPNWVPRCPRCSFEDVNIHSPNPCRSCVGPMMRKNVGNAHPGSSTEGSAADPRDVLLTCGQRCVGDDVVGSPNIISLGRELINARLNGRCRLISGSRQAPGALPKCARNVLQEKASGVRFAPDAGRPIDPEAADYGTMVQRSGHWGCLHVTTGPVRKLPPGRQSAMVPKPTPTPERPSFRPFAMDGPTPLDYHASRSGRLSRLKCGLWAV